MQLRIRSLGEDDVERAAALLARSWAWSYGDVVAAEAMPDIDDHAATLRAPRTTSWVAVVEDGAPVGVVGLDGAELTALHVEPAAQGAGVGSALHDYVLAVARERGLHELVTIVPRQSAQARDFCARRGWRIAAAGGPAAADRYGGAPALRLTRPIAGER